ncbi:VanZ family protein [Acetivibrio thermocellus]|uniref:VanZ family protein n=1 Tax=Acetivibrio thermocellus TaxID=1515 RepID=UPI00017E25FE|nr:VanZ family protein [Acetivibrio thermocellus]THJ76635.1 VanZ family protein [Acetivibrio thermocellus]
MEKKIETKRIISDIFLFIFTTIVSFLICYIFLDDLFIPAFITELGRISFRLFVSYLIFILIKWVFNKEITANNQKIVYILYFVLLIGLSLSRPSFYPQSQNINLKLGYFNDISKYVLVANIFMYFPLGFFAKKFLKIKSKNIISLFILYILVIETMQFLFKVGYFDINDILLNLIGFISGLFVFSLINKLKTKERAGDK